MRWLRPILGGHTFWGKPCSWHWRAKCTKWKKVVFLQKDNGESGGYFHKKSIFCYFSQILAFLSFWASYLRFWLIWCHALPKNNTSVVPRWFFDIWVPKLWPQKIKLFGPKTAKFGQRNGIFAKYCPLWPIWCHAWQKMQKKCLGGFFICGYQSFHSLPKSLGFLAPNRPKYAVLAKYLPFRSIWSHAWPKIASEKPRWVATVLVPKIQFPPPKNRFFGQNSAKFMAYWLF